MFKRSDYIILSIISFFLGVLLISQSLSSKEVKKISQPENNAVLALEVAKLTKVNADLRSEVKSLASDLDNYKDTSESRKKSLDQYLIDSKRLDIINASKSITGQGVIIRIDGVLNTPQVVDLINAIKNIGSEVIAVNDYRLSLDTDLSRFSSMSKYEIKVLGNSRLLKSAMERKGGIVEQIATKDIEFTIEEKENLEVSAGLPIKFEYAHIIKEQ